MKRIRILLLLISWLGVSLHAQKPNVVIFLADDQGWGDLSINGNRQLQTPHIDSIARAGARLDRFFVQPVCAPTRAEFFTGRYHPRGGVRGVSTGLERLNLDEETIGNTFKKAGYATGTFGKWHNGSQWPYHPKARGFDEYYGFTSGHWGEYFDPPLDHNGNLVRGQGFIADDFTGKALQFIEKNKNRPFFCYVPLNTPHSPWAVPDSYWQRFKNKEITQRGRNPQENIDSTRCALAMCENIDWNVGRVLEKLGELGLKENTIVIYFSDNGPNTPRWNGNMKGIKGSVDEGGLRVPFHIQFPRRIKPGLVIQEIAGAIDILPTLARLADIPLTGPKKLDGLDLSPLLLQDGKPWPDRMLFGQFGPRTSVRTQRFRLDDTGALFDMKADPDQTRNVAAEHPETTAQLKEAVTAWKKETGGYPADERPYPVGYVEFPKTYLPARDGIPHGQIKRSAAAPNCSFFANWTNMTSHISWNVEVNTTGLYEVIIHYTCPARDVGSKIQVTFGEAQLTGKITEAWDPPLHTHQDTIPRPPAESPMKEFRPLKLGQVRLEKGKGALELKALEIPGTSVMDVRLIEVNLVGK